VEKIHATIKQTGTYVNTAYANDLNYRHKEEVFQGLALWFKGWNLLNHRATFSGASEQL